MVVNHHGLPHVQAQPSPPVQILSAAMDVSATYKSEVRAWRKPFLASVVALRARHSTQLREPSFQLLLSCQVLQLIERRAMPQAIGSRWACHTVDTGNPLL